jgi:hypothetical protein
MTDDTKPTNGIGDKRPTKKPANRRSAAESNVITITGIPLEEGKAAEIAARTPDRTIAYRLTAKQEAFCQHVAAGNTLSASYRLAYPASLSWPDGQVWKEASLLAKNPKVIEWMKAHKAELKAQTPHDPGEVKAKVIRRLVTLLEDERLKPLEVAKIAELLGRWGEVALFDDKSTIKVETVEPEQAIEALKDKLKKLAS